MSERNAEAQTARELRQAYEVIAELEARLDEVNARLFKAERGNGGAYMASNIQPATP